jgi:hypothetical protein
MFPPFAAVSILTYRATVSRKLNIRAQKNQVELSWLLYSFLKNPIPIIGLYTIVKDTSGSLIFENVVYSLVRTLESKMKKKKNHFSSLSRNPKRKKKKKKGVTFKK